MQITLPEFVLDKNPLFSKLLVKDTMRNHVVSLVADQPISSAIRTLTRHKKDALLVENENGQPVGVVTKTELMGGYYAMMPRETPISDIMGSPVISCKPEDTLESALITMQESVIHRIYVIDQQGKCVGTLAYPDIVGRLYKFCCDCDFSLHKKLNTEGQEKLRYSIKEVMNNTVHSVVENDSIMTVIEALFETGSGAVLVMSDGGKPVGVISKTNLSIAYCRGVPLEQRARVIMHGPLKVVREDSSLEEGIRQMIFSEVGRLFITSSEGDTITGVLSLSDAARIRSGSCHACSSSRIKVGV